MNKESRMVVRAGVRTLQDFLDERLADDPHLRTALEDERQRSALLRGLIRKRTTAGMTQATVAKGMGTTQSAVSDLEAGSTDPRLSTLQRYARAIGCRLSPMIDGQPVTYVGEAPPTVVVRRLESSPLDLIVK